jgi:hypothetical protein
MKNLKVVKLDGDEVVFENDIRLSSDHQQDCCESHYLSFNDLTIEDFEGLEFDLSDDKFFNRIEDYGIELVPLKGYTVKVPGYGSNNGYYSSHLDLVLTDGKDFNKTFDITECQDYDPY